MKLIRDINGVPIQWFAPRKIVAVTSGQAWTPEGSDVMFRVGEACAYYIDSESSLSASLIAGSITTIYDDVTSYTFDTTMNIEVM